MTRDVEPAAPSGWEIQLWNAASRLVRPFGTLTVDVLLERDLRRPIAAENANIDITIREATEDDLVQVTQLYANEPYLYLGDVVCSEAGSASCQSTAADPAALAQYRDRLRRGEKCFLAHSGSEIAHVNWMCFTWAEAVYGHPIYLRAGEVYTTEAFTVPAYRGRNVHANVLATMLQMAQQAGYRVAYTVTRLERRQPFRAFRALGWRTAGKMLCFTPHGSGRARIVTLSGSAEPLLRGPVSGP